MSKLQSGGNLQSGDFALRRSTAPYRTLSTVFGLFAIWGLVEAVTSGNLALKSGNWNLFGVGLMIIGSYLPVIFIGYRYRIFLRDGIIVQKAYGMSDVAIKIKDISALKVETSSASDVAKMNRPFARIAIYSGTDRARSFIDVSLKHFVADDIRRLMRAIQEQRPDLTMPKYWL